MMYHVYWKTGHACLVGSATAAARTVAAALTAAGFTVLPENAPRRLTAERVNGLPGLPFVYRWTAEIASDPAGHAQVAVEYGLRATAGTWIALAAAIVLVFPLVFLSQAVPALTMIPMAPIVWLGAAVIAMKLHQAGLERRLWRAIAERTSVTTTVRSVS